MLSSLRCLSWVAVHVASVVSAFGGLLCTAVSHVEAEAGKNVARQRPPGVKNLNLMQETR